MKILYRQCNLESGNEHLVAWLPMNLKLKVGVRVRLEDSENPLQWWMINSVGETLLPKDEIKGSHNSKGWHDKDYHEKLKGLNIQKNV